MKIYKHKKIGIHRWPIEWNFFSIQMAVFFIQRVKKRLLRFELLLYMCAMCTVQQMCLGWDREREQEGRGTIAGCYNHCVLVRFGFAAHVCLQFVIIAMHTYGAITAFHVSKIYRFQLHEGLRFVCYKIDGGEKKKRNPFRMFSFAVNKNARLCLQ